MISTLIISIFFGLIGIALLLASFISFAEKEINASNKLLATMFVSFMLMVMLGFTTYPGKSIVAMLVVLAIIGTAYFFVKAPIAKVKSNLSAPKRNVDEHNVIFARMRLTPNTADWENYYSNHPFEATEDAKARALPGLLSKNSTYYNPFTYTTSHCNFDIISYLHKAINHPKAEHIESFSSDKLTSYIKNWGHYLGVHSIGITRTKNYHFYTHRGRGSDKGKPVEVRHQFAIAFTVEMDNENVQSGPMSSIVFESTQQYLSSATIALQFAIFLKRLGYDSRAHIDGDYEVICPLVARDAGLGEIGRMGLLMTPKLGPRVRIAVVTTNAPLICDEYKEDPTMVEFCKFCKKCADCCPSKSIPNGDMKEYDGVLRWKINSEQCFQYWCTVGTDCGRCIAVCPFSHPNNILHNTIRHLIRRSTSLARIAYLADDLLYGRKPRPKSLPKWMKMKND